MKKIAYPCTESPLDATIELRSITMGISCSIRVPVIDHFLVIISLRRDVPVGAPLDLSTPTGMSCIGTYGENCKSDNMSKYRVLLVAFLQLWHEN